MISKLLADKREVELGTVNNWCRTVIVWNLMLDSDRGPNRSGQKKIISQSVGSISKNQIQHSFYQSCKDNSKKDLNYTDCHCLLPSVFLP